MTLHFVGAGPGAPDPHGNRRPVRRDPGSAVLRRRTCRELTLPEVAQAVILTRTATLLADGG